MLRRKVAFRTGSRLVSRPQFNDQNELLTFTGVPDILPVERISEYTLGEIEKGRVKALQG